MTIFFHIILFYKVTFKSRVLIKQFNINVITFIYNVTKEIHLNNTVDTQILWQIPPKNGFDLETISLSKTSSAFMTASKNSLSMF
jgi:hypothetical protein